MKCEGLANKRMPPLGWGNFDYFVLQSAGQSNCQKCLSSWQIRSVEELETQLSTTKSRTTHHDRLEERNAVKGNSRQFIDRERTRQGQRQPRTGIV